MNYKKCTILACIMLLAACGPDDDKPADSNPSMLEPWQNDTPLPVKLTPGEASTRAADGLMNGNLPSGTDITVVIDGQEYTYQTNDAQTEMTCITTPVPYYPINGQSISIKAYYPTIIGSDGWYSSTNPWSWCVDKDQSTENGYKNSDRMYATVSSGYNGLDADGKVKPTSNAVPLTFNHLMAKVVLTITQPDDGTKITKVALGSVKTGYNMDCVNNRTDNAYFHKNNSSGTIILYNNANGATGTVTCAGVFPPQTIGTDVDFITVTTTENTIFYKLPQSVNFAAGQQHNYALSTKIDKSGIKVGQVLCSDGTLCDYDKRGNKTPVALVVYVGDTGNSKYNRGLAMALKNYGSQCQWGYAGWTNPKYSSPNTSIPGEDGSNYRTGKYIEGGYPPFRACVYFSPTAPNNTSGWFLPSADQMSIAVQSLNKNNMALKSCFSPVGGTNMSSTYWTCTEYDYYDAIYFFTSSGSLDHERKTIAEYVRAMLAF